MATGITRDQVERWFTYHPPKAGQPERYAAVREQARAFAIAIFENTPPGDDQLKALSCVRQAVSWANGAIALETPPGAPGPGPGAAG